MLMKGVAAVDFKHRIAKIITDVSILDYVQLVFVPSSELA